MRHRLPPRNAPDGVPVTGDRHITDLDAWRRVCLTAFDNLPSDTGVTMAQVDAVLTAGARRFTSEPTGGGALDAWFEEIGAPVGLNFHDVDAILSWCAGDAAKLLTEPRAS